MKIGITNTLSRYENYALWIKNEDQEIEIIQLCFEAQNWEEIENCDGIVLTGGIDLHPSFYDNEREDYPAAPTTFSKERDEFEMHVFETALNLQIPILGICRGLQLINVSLGGTLIQDLEEQHKNDHKRHGEIDTIHALSVHTDSLLFEITQAAAGQINSAHHQAIGEMSDELQASAFSPDQVVEAIEWKNKENKPWLLAVQWHPERMLDKDLNVFSKKIRTAFLKNATH